MPQTLTTTNGVDGRVRKVSGSVILACVTGWDLTKPVGTTPILTFESSADSKGTVWANRLKGAGGDWKISITGVCNLNTTDQTETGTTSISDGLYVALDLYVSKALGKGYPNCLGYVENFKIGQKMGNDACVFTADVAGDGPPPAYGTIT